MMSIIGSVLSLAGPLIMWMIKNFLKTKERQERAVKNYYEFIASIDKKSADKVANYLAAETELERVQNMIREKQLKEPVRPSESGKKPLYEIPQIEVVDVDIKTHGQYLTESGQEKGLVVHYTAGRFDRGAQSAKNTLTHLASKGLGCLVMDSEGIIYKAKSQMLDEIAWHAGKSAWAGKTGVSRYCLGMEICNAGKLEKDGKSWFGLQIPNNAIREIPLKIANQAPGKYHKFTPAQEKSLINFILWRLDVNPDFDIDWLVGHDEISPGRKSDPGGSLSMTLIELRNHLRELRG